MNWFWTDHGPTRCCVSCRQMKRIGSGQLMVTEGDKVLTPSQLGLIGAVRPVASPARHQQLFLHSIQEDGSSQVLPVAVCGSSLLLVLLSHQAGNSSSSQVLPVALCGSSLVLVPLSRQAGNSSFFCTASRRSPFDCAAEGCGSGLLFGTAVSSDRHQQLLQHSLQEIGFSQGLPCACC